MAVEKGRQPDYQVHAMDKSSDLKAQIGAAWNEDNGRISVKLNGFINLVQDGNLMISLFPVNERDRDKWRKQREANREAGHTAGGEPKPF